MRSIACNIIAGIFVFFIAAPIRGIAQESAGAAEPEVLYVEGALQYTLPVPGADTERFGFWVFVRTTEVTQAAAQILSIQDQNGDAVPIDVFEIQLDQPTISTSGVYVTCAPRPTYSLKSGTYTLRVNIKAQTGDPGQPAKLTTTLTVKVPALQLNEEELKNQTIMLYRPWPWSAVPTTPVTLRLADTSLTSNLRDLSAYSQGIYRTGSKILTSGRMNATISPITTTPIPTSIATPTAQTDVVRQAALNLTLEDLRSAGKFDTSIILQAPRLENRITIPLTLEVSDRVYFPLFIILLGVAGGFVANLLARGQPRQQNRYQIERLRAELNGLGNTATSWKSRETLYGLRETLRSAEEKAEQQDAAGTKTELDNIRKGIQEFRKAQAKDMTDALEGQKVLVQKLEAYQTNNQQSLPESEKQTIATALTALRGVPQYLARNEIDQAYEIWQTNLKQFLDLRRANVRRQFENDPMAANWKTDSNVTSQVTSITGPLETEQQIEQAEQSLSTLRLQSSRGVASGNMSFGRPTGDEAMPENVENTPPPPTKYIDIKKAPENCVSGAPIDFKLVMPDATLQDDDVVHWDFGDSTPTMSLKGKFSCGHRFDAPDNYQVEAQVERQGEIVEHLSTLICILPNRAEKRLVWLSRGLILNSIGQSLIALLLASLTGLWQLYLNQSFGSLTDYLTAFLWGFGIDSTVRGFGAVVKKLSE